MKKTIYFNKYMHIKDITIIYTLIDLYMKECLIKTSKDNMFKLGKENLKVQNIPYKEDSQDFSNSFYYIYQGKVFPQDDLFANPTPLSEDLFLKHESLCTFIRETEKIVLLSKNIITIVISLISNNSLSSKGKIHWIVNSLMFNEFYSLLEDLELIDLLSKSKNLDTPDDFEANLESKLKQDYIEAKENINTMKEPLVKFVKMRNLLGY